MGLYSKMLVYVLASIALIVGILFTFTLVTGISKPFEFFSKIQLSISIYLLVGILLLAAILIFGIFIFFKEKFLGYS
jgi:hypothetical protein